ncbi:right-handed parallel beta-helix repeat-containing protein [Hugenholtzia roseola]|uniref:right-handed parallel beta-helix repeat-containing protein n=1 Tax=Hugenholtzia roseola TaxID=1002 RepID=UPI0003FABA5A|nr:right-handed parallel beta-helix repeat-containing protein [Hugenholtzia roseola]
MRISTFFPKFCGFVALLLLTTFAQAQIRYVKPTATGTGDGSSWANASNDLQGMINASNAGEQVWVAAGTYKPTQVWYTCPTCTLPQQRSILLKSGVQVYGGFAGTETTTAARNNFAPGQANETILSGDLNDDDNFDINNGGYQGTTGNDNVYHVVVSTYTTAGHTTILDGFTIKGGHAGSAPWSVKGAGIHATMNVAATQIFRNNHLINNQAWEQGGGIYLINNNAAGTFLVENNVIDQNVNRYIPIPGATTVGAGIYAENSGTLTITQNQVSNSKNLGTSTWSRAGGVHLHNKADGTTNFTYNTVHSNTSVNNYAYGAGVDVLQRGAVLNFTHNTVYNNLLSTAVGAGAHAFGGGLFVEGRGTQIIEDNTFYGNQAQQGGAMNIYTDFNATGGFTVRRNHIYNNEAATGGGIMFDNRRGITTIFEENQIHNNTAVGSGGGIWARNSWHQSPATIIFENNDIYDNTLTGSGFISGGGIWTQNPAQGGNIIINNNRVHGNSAGTSSNPTNFVMGGGGIWADNGGGSLTITNNEVYENSSNNGGGGIAVFTGRFSNNWTQLVQTTISGNNVYDNQALYKGGGIALEVGNRGICNLEQNQIHGNSTLEGGGLYILANQSSGGGISGISNATGNQIYDNSANNGTGGAQGKGGGVALLIVDDATSNFHSNQIYGNASEFRGGGMYSETERGGMANHHRNAIHHNTANEQGGGAYVYLSSFSSATVRQQFVNNTIYENSAQSGGGMSVIGGQRMVFDCINNTFYGNAATSLAGALLTSNGANNSHVLNYQNNIFWGNRIGTNTDAPGSDILRIGFTNVNFTNITHNIVQPNSIYDFDVANQNLVQDPLFVNAAAGDFRLQPASLAVDNGSNAAWATTGLNTDKGGFTRPMYCVVDRGAYELQEPPVGLPPTDVYVWNGSVDSDWFKPQNWTFAGCDPNGIPSCAYNVLIPNACPNYPIIDKDGASCRDIHVANGTSNPSLGFVAGKKLEVCGDFIHSGTLSTPNAGRVDFIGLQKQYYIRTATAQGEFNDVVINNQYTDLNDPHPDGISDALVIVATTLTKGTDVYTGIGNLILSNTGTLSFLRGRIRTESTFEVVIKNRNTNAVQGHNIDRFIEGRIRRYHNSLGSYDFPVGLKHSEIVTSAPVEVVIPYLADANMYLTTGSWIANQPWLGGQGWNRWIWNNYAQIDLGVTHFNISELVLSGCPSCFDNDRYVVGNINLSYSTNGTTWVNYGSVPTGFPSNTGTGNDINTIALTPFDARYIRITIPSSTGGLRFNVNKKEEIASDDTFVEGKGYQLANINFTSATTIDNLLAYFNEYTTLPGGTNQTECSYQFSCDAADNGFWTINAHDAAGTAIAGDGVYSATLYNRLYTNMCGIAAQVMKKPHGATGGWTIPTGTCGSLLIDDVSRHGLVGFSDFGTAQSEFEILPVEMVRFEAKAGEQVIILDWEIISDQDLDKFVLERSTEEKPNQFVPITTLTAKGNLYQFVDTKVEPNRLYYYRLYIVEKDGSTKYSHIRSASIFGQAAKEGLLYPNPTQDRVSLVFGQIQPQYLQLYNAEGRLLQTKVIEAQETQTDLDLSAYPSGIYLLKAIRADGQNQAYKIVKE